MLGYGAPMSVSNSTYYIKIKSEIEDTIGT